MFNGNTVVRENLSQSLVKFLSFAIFANLLFNKMLGNGEQKCSGCGFGMGGWGFDIATSKTAGVRWCSDTNLFWLDLPFLFPNSTHALRKYFWVFRFCFFQSFLSFFSVFFISSFIIFLSLFSRYFSFFSFCVSLFLFFLLSIFKTS